ncbi:hypothetical protein [Pedobacter sp.]|uniref:hypothetical protein n=1 Tax=Pedobacter sp. TaxID=1411316 RepID=UPI00396C86F9
MANSIAKVYSDAVKENQKVLYGVWEPGFPVKLGDFGVMEGNIFVQQGNIANIEELKDLKIKIRKDNSSDEKFFTSKTGVQFELKPQVKANVQNVPVNASIEISFSKENAVFFNAAQCRFEMIENKFQVGQRLLELHKKNKNIWRREYVLVTDRVVAKRALIVISTSNDYSITLEAAAKVPVIDLANASLGLSIKSQKSSGYKVVTEEGLIPLIGLSKIQSSFLWFDNEFKPYAKNYSDMMLETIKNSPLIQTEESNKDLIFAQYTEDIYA